MTADNNIFGNLIEVRVEKNNQTVFKTLLPKAVFASAMASVSVEGDTEIKFNNAVNFLNC